MVDHREAKQFSNIISLSFGRKGGSSKSTTVYMVLTFIQYLLMISPENSNLNKTKLETLISFRFKFQYILFYTLLVMLFYFSKKLTQIGQSVETQRTGFLASYFQLV